MTRLVVSNLIEKLMEVEVILEISPLHFTQK
jgi:hypothetical protein